MYTKSRGLRTVLANIVRICRGANISLIPTYIASASNELADALSRMFGSQHAHTSASFIQLLRDLFPHHRYHPYRDPPLDPLLPLLLIPPWPDLPRWLRHVTDS
jgi:hypothetical protein